MADAENNASAGTVETKAEVRKTPADFARHWLEAIDMAGTDEKDWRDDAEATLKRYRSYKPQSFNILYANTQTTVPALYNSEPAVDVRTRFGVTPPTRPTIDPADPQAQAKKQAYDMEVAKAQQEEANGKAIATTIERFVTIQAEMYDFDGCMKSAVKDRQLQGRGVTRVRVVKGEQGSKWIECEPVQWDDFRHGPAKTWQDVPWNAFRHKLTRDELVALNPKLGPEIKLDAVVGDAPQKQADTLPDMFKRAVCWEVWDKSERRVYWFAESNKNEPLADLDDPYRLRDFLPVPRPLYAVETTDTLKPVCEFMIWKPLADEMDTLTARIIGIVKVMKLRGIYDGSFAAEVKKLSQLDDGELAAAEDAARAMKQGGIDKAVWMWPVDLAIQVVQGLYEAREQAKMALYELTGVADIMRGQTEASETLGAQRMKAQWGSLRLQEAQRDVQRYARDLYRMMGDLMAEVFDAAELAAITGIQLTPEQYALMKRDISREYVIEIETDSTIRADLSRAQENIAGFVTGFGAFLESIGPAVQAGYMPPEVAVGLLQAFARYYKLGREAEAIMEKWKKDLEKKAQQPPQPPPPDPKVEAEKVKAAAAAQKAQADVQMVQVKAQAEQQSTQMDTQAKAAEFQMKMQTLAAEFQKFQAEYALQAKAQQDEAALQERQHQLAAEDQMRSQEAAEHGHGLKMEVMDAQAKAKQAAARKPNGGGR